MEKPLITIGLTCYNQEKYIREALEGCFAQTYFPLEIIVSDNHSTDGSASIIGDMIDEYKRKGGRHTVIYNKNETNIGYVGNLLKIFRLMHGELLVEASGDDISFPDRVEIIANEWVKTNKRANLVAHGGRRIDTHGNALGLMRPSDDTRKTGLLLAHEMPSDWFVGAFHAYSPRILSEFADPKQNLTGVDNLFGFRALMLGPILYLDDILIKYRVDSGVSTGVISWRQSRLSQSKRLMQQLYQALVDLDNAKQVDDIEEDVIRAKINARINALDICRKYLSAKSFRERCHWYNRGASWLLPVKLPKMLRKAILISPKWMSDVTLRILWCVIRISGKLYGYYIYLSGKR